MDLNHSFVRIRKIVLDDLRHYAAVCEVPVQVLLRFRDLNFVNEVVNLLQVTFI